MERMTLRYFGHACFSLQFSDYRIIFDPYREGSVPGLKAVRSDADLVLCSHGHNDHNASDSIRLSGRDLQGLTVTKFMTPHDDKNGSLRGSNTVHMLSYQGRRIVHLGDIGIIPPKELLEQIFQCDVLFIPVGGYYTLPTKEAAAAIKAISPKYAFPMHYRSERSGYPVLGSLKDLEKYSTVNELSESEIVLSDFDFVNTKIMALKAENEE